MVNSKALGLNYDNMNWNPNEQSDSENEILQMSSTRMQEDSVRVRLLSVSEDDEIRETTPRDAGVPQLHFRRNNGNFTKAQEEKKSRCAVLSILIVGVMLIVIINIGLGIKLKSMKDITSVPPPTCQENEHPKVDGCDESFPWQSYRLPTTIKPVQYKIFLHPNLTQEKYVGNIDVTIKVTESTNMIVLHSKDLDLKEVKVLKNLYGKGQNPVVSQNGKYRTCEEYDFLAILLKENLLLHHQYVVQISFAGDLGKSLRGFYKSEYRTQSGMNKTLATTQFESTDARSAFPCFDEPAFKANFSLSIVRNADYIALSNMPVKETKPYEDHLELDEFETSVAMSTYLLAFIVCDFASVTETIHLLDGPVKVSVYAPKDKIATAPYALNVSCEVLGFYEKVFKVPYPLPKLDLVAIPDFEAGAMENWGLVTYREKLILWDQNSSSIFDQEHVAMVIAHELAHQWFGNLVTMKWWNDLWLNEGFASYMEFYGVDGIMPSWHRMELFYSEHTYDAMQTDESEYTHPITVPVDSRIQIEEVFDDISYSKAGCVIEMMIDYLGRDTFMNGVTDYLQSFAYRNANNSDLVKSVANRANTNQQRTNVLKMLDSWTTEPGFPILNVSLMGNEIVMSQIRYLLSVEGDEEDPSCQKPLKSPLWHIPVSYKTDSSDTVEWAFLQNKTDKFTIAGNMAGPKWVIFNVQRGGYYLINYSKDLLASLSTQLKENHTVFSVLDRSGIIFNVAKSAKAGYISYDVVFDLLLYLKSENEYLPISTATNILLDIASVLKVQYQTDAYANMKMFSHKLVRPFYTRYGWPKSNHIDSSLTHPEIKLRKLVVNLMCYVDEPDCTTKALRMFNMWKENGTLLHPDYKDIVYSTAIRLGPSTNWDFMWNKYATDLTLDAHEKQKLLSALCHTAEESKIVFLLDEAMEGKNIRHQNTRDVFALLRSTRIGGIIAWRYMRSRWSDLAEIYPIGSFATQSLLRVFNIFTDESDIATGEKFLALNNLSDIRFAKRALDHAKLNVNWIRTYQPQIEKWLNENLDKV